MPNEKSYVLNYFRKRVSRLNNVGSWCAYKYKLMKEKGFNRLLIEPAESID